MKPNEQYEPFLENENNFFSNTWLLMLISNIHSLYFCNGSQSGSLLQLQNIRSSKVYRVQAGKIPLDNDS